MFNIGDEIMRGVLAIEGFGKGLFKFDSRIKVLRGGTLALQRNPGNSAGNNK